MRLLEAAAALGARPGERPLLVAEQLALEQSFRERRAVDGDELPGAVVRARLVDRAGDLFLAGPSFANDQDRRVGLGDVADQVEDVEHPRRLGEDILEGVPRLQLLAEHQDFVLECPLFEGALDHDAEVLRVGGLGEEVVRAAAHRGDRVGDAAVAGGDDDRDGDLAGVDFLDQLHAVHFGHAQVGNQHRVRARLEHFERLQAVGGGVDFQV